MSLRAGALVSSCMFDAGCFSLSVVLICELALVVKERLYEQVHKEWLESIGSFFWRSLWVFGFCRGWGVGWVLFLWLTHFYEGSANVLHSLCDGYSVFGSFP